MNNFTILEPAIDPNNRITFLLDWEVTMKCNLDCSYCGTSGPAAGHDNSTQHPKVEKCFETIDFMFKYVDLYMESKPKGIKHVVLNVYGGESLHHPDIIDILKKCHQIYNEIYKDRWSLTITTTTNAIITKKKLLQIIPLIDEFTVSYHTESTEKQKQQFRDNLLLIKDQGKKLKCIILIHSDPVLFEDSLKFEKWCQENSIRYLPKQLDHGPSHPQFKYEEKQVIWFNKLYKKRSYNTEITLPLNDDKDEKYDLSSKGRSCCGGRQLVLDEDYKKRSAFVKNNFQGWYCSVNEFFLFIKQINGEIYTNKDCRMNFSGEIGPIGNLNNAESLLRETQANLKSENRKIIQCKKTRCACGLCAPKAQIKEDFNRIMKKYQR